MHVTVTNLRSDDPWRAELNYGNWKFLVRKAILLHSELSGGKNENKTKNWQENKTLDNRDKTKREPRRITLRTNTHSVWPKYNFENGLLHIPDTTTVENFEPNLPFEDNLHGDGCWFCNWPAKMDSSAVRKCVFISRRCFTVPFLTSSATRSVNIQPTFWRPRSAASLSTMASEGSERSLMLSGVPS